LKLKLITLESKTILHIALQNALLWVAESASKIFASNMSRSELSFQGIFFTSWAPNLLKRYEQKMDLCSEIPTNLYRIYSVLQIRDVYTGSQIQIFYPRSRPKEIPDPDPHKIILIFFTQKFQALGILPGMFNGSSRIRNFFPSRIERSKSTGSRIRIRNTGSIAM
jgi:hypothetical protein